MRKLRESIDMDIEVNRECNDVAQRVLVVGAGLIGSALAEALHCAATAVRLASRTPIDVAIPWQQFDATDPNCWSDVRLSFDPDVVVLVHGPSDVTACESDPEGSARAHSTATELAYMHVPRAWKLLISTDNVFSGRDAVSYEDDLVEPCNAYGMAKRAAEEVVLANNNALVLRVSVVYGWESIGRQNRTPNYFVKIVDSLRRGAPFDAPVDHWNTPVLLDDLVAVCSEAIDKRATGILNIGGPERVSRWQWARIIAEELEADVALVSGKPKSETTYACRPDNGGLASRRHCEFESFSHLHTVREGTRALLAVDLSGTSDAPDLESPATRAITH